jgi:hypothetical protein
MTKTSASILVAAALALAVAADAAIPDIPASNGMGGTIACNVVAGTPVRGHLHDFDGVPIDINVAFPAVPGAARTATSRSSASSTAGAARSSSSRGSMQEWVDAGYAVFSMSDRGWGKLVRRHRSEAPQPVCAEGYNHLLDYALRGA